MEATLGQFPVKQEEHYHSWEDPLSLGGFSVPWEDSWSPGGFSFPERTLPLGGVLYPMGGALLLLRAPGLPCATTLPLG